MFHFKDALANFRAFGYEKIIDITSVDDFLLSCGKATIGYTGVNHLNLLKI